MNEFVPTKKIFVIIANRHYDEKRKIKGFENFDDIPEVDEDAINVKNGLKGLGARLMDIRVVHDASRADFSELFRDLDHELY